jgi:hypothetical protein
MTNKHTNLITGGGVVRATIGDLEPARALAPQTTSGHLVGGLAQVIFNDGNTQVATDAGVHRHELASTGAPSAGIRYSTPLGTPIAAADAKPTDRVHFANGIQTTVAAARAAGLL